MIIPEFDNSKFKAVKAIANRAVIIGYDSKGTIVFIRRNDTDYSGNEYPDPDIKNQ